MRHNATYYNAPGSYKPKISGFSQMPEDRDKSILVPSSRQYNELKAIEEIDPVDLIPWGDLPQVPHPDTKRFILQRRSPKGLWPEVWYRINLGSRDVIFEIQFSRHDRTPGCVARIPIESWERFTCDAEAVRAAIQQDYLNRICRVPHASIVKPGMKSLPLCSWDEFKNNPAGKWFKLIPLASFARERAAYDAPRSSTSSKTAAWVQMHASYDERYRYRPQQSLSPVLSPFSSRVPQYPEVYDRRRYYDTSYRGSPSSDDYPDTLSLTETYTSYVAESRAFDWSAVFGRVGKLLASTASGRGGGEGPWDYERPYALLPRLL